MRSVYSHHFLFLFVVFPFVGCVSSGKFSAMQQQAQKSDSLYAWSMRTLKACQDSNDTLRKQKTAIASDANMLDMQLTASKENNTLLRKQLQELSALSTSQAESIKRSLDNIGAKDAYIMDLRAAISRRDSTNLVVLMDLKATMGAQPGVNITLDKGTLYVDLSDSLLFSADSNSFVLNAKAKNVLGRLARVMRDQPDIGFAVEGHTDSIAPAPDAAFDNWDISVMRATAIVRLLQKDYNIAPTRMTAMGRSEYIAVAPNDTPEGRSANRRTRVIILPQTDRLNVLLSHKEGEGALSAPAPATPQATSGS
jgi:chemotaxis protein MotB